MPSLANVTFRPAIDFSPSELAQFLSVCFEDYIVNIPFTPALVMSMVRTESVDLTCSPIAFVDGELAGAALIGRRSRESRLAAMAIPKAFRGKGIGRKLVEQVLEESKARSEEAMYLECIASNESALKLYESCGFSTVRELWGFSRPPGQSGGSETLEEVPLSEVALLGRLAPSDLPWQASWQTLAASSLPSRAFRLGDAFAAITDPAQQVVAIRAIVVDGETRCGSGSSMVQALIAQWPDTSWRIPPIWPAEVAPGFWEQNGFTRDALSQVQMVKRF